MKKIFLILTFLLLNTIIVSAVTISEKEVRISINDDGSSDWYVKLVYPNPVEMSNIFVLADVSFVSVYANDKKLDCSINTQSLGTSIICNNVNSSEIEYKFKIYGLVERRNNMYIFSYSFPTPNIVKKFDLTVKLPIGAVIADKNEISHLGLEPFTPSDGTEGTDGRQIFVKWLFENPELGKSIDVSVIYEKPFMAFPFVSNLIFIIGVLVVVVTGLGFYIYRRSSVEKVLPILDKPEREVMKIILRDRKNINQKKIVKEVGYSKAKVSRIVKSLEQRGLITVERRGRTNIISLKKKI